MTEPIIILTAGDAKFKDFISVSRKRAEKFNYKFLVYDLGGLGWGEKFGANFEKEDGVLKNLWKFPLILDAFRKNDYKIVWLDADAILWNKLDIDWDFDIGVTIRRQKEMTDYDEINSGVIFVNNTKEAGEFLKEMCEREGKTDQSILTNAVSEVTGFTRYYETFNRTNVRIKTFPTDKYNCYYFNEDLNNKDNRILHFKGNMREAAL